MLKVQYVCRSGDWSSATLKDSSESVLRVEDLSDHLSMNKDHIVDIVLVWED